MKPGALLLLTCVLALGPAPAEACSCGEGPADLVTNLRYARDGAEAIIHARVVSVEHSGGFFGLFGLGPLEATLEVLESFKGSVGAKLVLPSADGFCGFPYETGGEYLVYAARDGGRWVTIPCSRTRPITPDDVELEWLRTGRSPLVPVALQRETVQCETCDLETVARTLVGLAPGDTQNPRLKDDAAVKALREARPFWTGGYYNHEDPSRRTAVGLSSDLRPFELLQTPADGGTRERCLQHVSLRWCERLEVSPGTSPELRCVNPGAAQDRCDETRSRTARWGPKERIEAAQCHWGRPDQPWCTLPKEPQPLANEAPASPLLLCKPVDDGSFTTPSTPYFCRVVPANASP